MRVTFRSLDSGVQARPLRPVLQLADNGRLVGKKTGTYGARRHVGGFGLDRIGPEVRSSRWCREGA